MPLNVNYIAGRKTLDISLLSYFIDENSEP